MMRHRFHALCPYFAMFPESFAEYWIKASHQAERYCSGSVQRPGDDSPDGAPMRSSRHLQRCERCRGLPHKSEDNVSVL